MLAFRYRFHTRGSVRYVQRQGRGGRTRSFGIKVVANARRRDSRCAVVVTKKVVKSAVARNRIRRRVYEIVRHYWPQLKPGQDLLISVYDARIGEMPDEHVRTQIFELLKSMDLIVKADESLEPSA